MQEVAILGVGQTPVREHWELSLRDLAVDAGRAALQDAGLAKVDAIYVGNMTSGTLNQQRHLGALVADHLGQRGVEAVKMEAACGSAGSAMRQGLLAVASGELEMVLVIGVEKMMEKSGEEITAALTGAADADYEVIHGISFVSLNALIMRRYMHEYGYQHGDFAPFALNAHANGAKNPNALFRKAISQQDYETGRPVADPINLFDASPIGDGAAALLLVPAAKAPQAVRVIGSASATDTLAIHDRIDPLWLSAAEKSARQAYDQAGIGPEDVDLFEAHDAFSIMAALSLEACGFAGPGQGVRLAQEGQILPTGRIPISTMGGLKARGHPVGATGLYQLVETTLQLRQQAGPAQVEGVHLAMAQNIGGSGATVVTHILQKPQ
ncbi:MAG: thiolase domain-containing protein [Chloroflexi bacterium]|nr:thiolase domain-containing protein [Chloroflexota bacterium]MCI0575849.1 thiolase domain-containing protein [Chloroflexota bacterium]MCI0646576.1 thiolase domain-containing protein [Chloroflexota bacterium]MCI0726378.1 thiolase domain-containing protein [Chloroflexota bacterium]